jgi:REP element-mobilizing transposase RayT
VVNAAKNEIYSLAEIMGAIKGASAQLINRELGRTGRVWQTESFDRVLRSSESLVAKIAYIVENPVKKGCRPLSRLFLDLGPARECNPSQSADTR